MAKKYGNASDGIKLCLLSQAFVLRAGGGHGLAATAMLQSMAPLMRNSRTSPSDCAIPLLQSCYSPAAQSKHKCHVVMGKGKG